MDKDKLDNCVKCHKVFAIDDATIYTAKRVQQSDGSWIDKHICSQCRTKQTFDSLPFARCRHTGCQNLVNRYNFCEIHWCAECHLKYNLVIDTVGDWISSGGITDTNLCVIHYKLKYDETIRIKAHKYIF